MAYGNVPQQHWAEFAQLVLDAAYEFTLLQAVLNARRGVSNVVLLTLLGGGAFGNATAWVHQAIRQAMQRVAGFELDVRVVSYGSSSADLKQLVATLQCELA